MRLRREQISIDMFKRDIITNNSSSPEQIEWRVLFRQERNDDRKGKPDICQCEPTEDQGDNVVLK